MSKLLENENGEIYIDNEVIAQFMASLSVKDGLAKLLKGDNVSRGVSVKMDDDGLYINFHIIVSYGVNIRTVVDNLISTVKYQVEDYTNMKVNKINVYVEGVRVID